MKRLILILLTFSLLVSPLTSLVSYANELTTVEEAVILANKEIKEQFNIGFDYYDISQINEDMWEKYKALVYGEPHGDKKGNMYRYIGYTSDGSSFGNPEFPRDDWTGGTFDERNWIEEPWKDSRTQSRGAKFNSFNGTPEFSDNMKAGLLKYYPNDTDGSRTDWHRYMYILQPPTEDTVGMAQMWHVADDGGIWYTVMTLPTNRETRTMLDKPTSEFEIYYEGIDYTDNENNPVIVDKYPITVDLVDKSISEESEIVDWNWQVWRNNKWETFSSEKNPTLAFYWNIVGIRLQVTDKNGQVSDFKNHTFYSYTQTQYEDIEEPDEPDDDYEKPQYEIPLEKDPDVEVYPIPTPEVEKGDAFRPEGKVTNPYGKEAYTEYELIVKLIKGSTAPEKIIYKGENEISAKK